MNGLFCRVKLVLSNHSLKSHRSCERWSNTPCIVRKRTSVPAEESCGPRNSMTPVDILGPSLSLGLLTTGIRTDCPTEEGDILGESLGFQGVSPLILHEQLLHLQGTGFWRLGVSGPGLPHLAWVQLRMMWRIGGSQPSLLRNSVCPQLPIVSLPTADRLYLSLEMKGLMEEK